MDPKTLSSEHAMPASNATEFASAGRAGEDTLARQSAYFASSPVFVQFMDYIPDLVLVVNSERQIVYANKASLGAGAAAGHEQFLGFRPGEFFGCIHGEEMGAGCGTSRFCSCCGAVRAILESQAGRSAVEECRITLSQEHGERAVELRIWATPIEFEGERFTFFVAHDIQDEKRREALERIFLHDVNNTAMTLQALSLLLNARSLLASSPKPTPQPDHVRQIRALADQLLDQLDSHRQLVAAESGQLQLRVAPVRSLELLEDIAQLHRSDVLQGRRIWIADDSCDVFFQSDKRLLSRVLRHMVKNGLEGSAEGDTVTLGCRLDDDRVQFWVQNRTYMPENVRLQIFVRSFSTKGAGRGLGTYTMKLLSERYLGGRLAFTSTEVEGTTFYASYPVVWKAPDGLKQE